MDSNCPLKGWFKLTDNSRMSENFLIRNHEAKEASRHIQEYYDRKPRKPVWREYAEVVVVALVAAVILRIFVVAAYRVTSSSMEDTLLTGDYIFVNKLAYTNRGPQMGDIVVFEYPLNRQRDYIKRVVALPGQTVEIIDKVVYVDGLITHIPADSKNIDPDFLARQLSNRDNFGPVLIPVDRYFVMGDNRDDSQDSRFWGFVPLDHIRGKAVFVYFSWKPADSPTEWSFPYIHTVFIELGSMLINLPTSGRWERIALAL